MTPQQTVVLTSLKHRGNRTTHEVADTIRAELPDSDHGYYDRAHATLARLQRRGLVGRNIKARYGDVASWYITHAGRKALAAL